MHGDRVKSCPYGASLWLQHDLAVTHTFRETLDVFQQLWFRQHCFPEIIG